MLLVFAILLIIILVVLVRCIVIVPQSNAYVTEWLGVYKDTWGAGLHIRTPFVERISRKVSLKEEAADFPPQPVITRDNVTMMIDTVVFFQVFDAKMYAYGVNRPQPRVAMGQQRFHIGTSVIIAAGQGLQRRHLVNCLAFSHFHTNFLSQRPDHLSAPLSAFSSASGVSLRVTSILSTRRLSISMTSKVKFSHSYVSVSRGIRPTP